MKTFLGIALITFCACSMMNGKQEPLSFIIEKNLGDRLRLDGCYYTLDSSRSHISIFVFYRNGIVADVGTYEVNRLDSIINSGRIAVEGKDLAKMPWVWGLYKIKSDSILTEKLYPMGLDYLTGINHGFVLNDTTIQFTSLTFNDRASMIVNETFHFLKLKTKPDSTNNFIPLN